MSTIPLTRRQDADELQQELRHLATGNSLVSIRVPVNAIPILLGLVRAEWDRRNQQHRINVATGGKL